MHYRGSIAALAMVAALTGATAALAFDETKYPNLKGQWRRAAVPGMTGQPSYDPGKPDGLAQGAPLTPEYQAILKASVADQAAGGPGNDPTYTCAPPGMPRVMIVYDPMEIIVTPNTTHMLMGHIHDSRRIFTDGRDWPAMIQDTFAGYSIGRWIDTRQDGHFDVLVAETRGFLGPRSFDASGLPLHEDNQTVIRERTYLDPADANLLHDEITTIDHALTRPWTALESYRRVPTANPVWHEAVCAEGNPYVRVGGEAYFLSPDGSLMPTKKGQTPPDLRYFKRPQK